MEPLPKEHATVDDNLAINYREGHRSSAKQRRNFGRGGRRVVATVRCPNRTYLPLPKI
jgi:hypothetical protein